MNTRQQGVALLVVLLILVLMVTVAAVITERNGRTYHRAVAQVEKLQANWYVRAAEAMAQKYCKGINRIRHKNVSGPKLGTNKASISK